MDLNDPADDDKDTNRPLVSFEQFQKEASLVLQVFEQLKSEYENEMQKLKANEEMTANINILKVHIEKSLERITLAMGEVEILITLSEYLQYLEVDKLRVDMMAACLISENEWLKTEYMNLYEKTATMENVIAATEVEKAYFISLYQRRKNDHTTQKKEATNHGDNDRDDMDNEVPLHLRAIYNLILEYTAQGRYEVAIGLCNRAIADIKNSHGETLDMAVMLNILALVNRDKGDLKEATTALEATLRIREKILGSNNLLVAATLNNLSVLLGKRGKFKESEPVCRKALKVREQLLGVNHPDVAKQLNNLALILQNLKKTNEIEELYMRAIQIYSKSSDRVDPNLLKTQNNLAAFHIRNQNYAAAMNVLKQVMTRYHEELLMRHMTKSLKPIFVFVDVSIAQGMRLVDIQAKFPLFGNVPNPVVKNSIKYYVSICKRLGKDKEAITMEKYLDWCSSGGSTRFNAEELLQKEREAQKQTLQYKIAIANAAAAGGSTAPSSSATSPKGKKK